MQGSARHRAAAWGGDVPREGCGDAFRAAASESPRGLKAWVRDGGVAHLGMDGQPQGRHHNSFLKSSPHRFSGSLPLCLPCPAWHGAVQRLCKGTVVGATPSSSLKLGQAKGSSQGRAHRSDGALRQLQRAAGRGWAGTLLFATAVSILGHRSCPVRRRFEACVAALGARLSHRLFSEPRLLVS